MQLILLRVPACPNAAAFEERLAAPLAGPPRAVGGRRGVRACAARGPAGAGALAWGGMGLAVAVLLAAGVLVIRRRRRACLSAGAADPQPRVETAAPRSGTR